VAKHGFECPACGERKGMSSDAATPASRGVKLRFRRCAACAARFPTVEVTSEGLFELIREWFGDAEANDIAREVFAECLELDKIANALKERRRYQSLQRERRYRERKRQAKTNGVVHAEACEGWGDWR